MEQDRLYSIDEALKIIPMSKSGLYAAINKGNVIAVTIGRRKFIPGSFLAQLFIIPSSA